MIFEDFNTALDEIILSERDAVGGFNDLVILKLFKKVDIESFGVVVDAIRHGDKAVSLIKEAVYNAIPYVEDETSCDITECDFDVNYDSRTWDLAMAECRYPVCMRSASRKFMAFYNRYKVLNPTDDEYAFVQDQITDILSDILANSLLAKIFLSDKSSTEDTLKGLDGLLVQWESDASRIIDVSEFRDNGELDGEGVYKSVKHLARAYKRDELTKATFDEAIIIIDENHANDLVDWLNDLGTASPGDCRCYSAEGVVRKEAFDLENLYIAGVRIVAIPYTSMSLQFPSLVDVEGNVDRDFFMAMTIKENNQIGVPKMSELEMADAFIDKKDRKWYFDYGYQFGVLVTTPVYLFAVNYLSEE